MSGDWTIFPLENPSISCGSRKDLFKKQRRHHWIPLGRDIRFGIEVEVYACERCGKDETRKINDDTTGGIPAGSDNPDSSVRENILPAGSARTVEKTNPI
jgi:hypothetical protein